MNCPKCQHSNTPNARFCQKCGEELPSQPATTAIPPVVPSIGSILANFPGQSAIVPPNEHTDTEAAAGKRFAALFGQENVGSGVMSKQEVPSASTEKMEVTLFTPPDAESKQLPVMVSYAVNRLFHEGGNFILEARVHPAQVPLSEVHAWLDITIAGETHTLTLESRKDKQDFHCYTNFYLPGNKNHVSLSGEALVKGYVLCVLPDGIQYYEYEVRHAIIASGHDKSTIINNYTLSGGSLLKVMGSIVNNTMSGDDIIRNINHTAPLFKEVKISNSEWRPEDLWMADRNQYRRPGCYDELTLEYGDMLIHILAKDDISIGRFKDNDIALVDWANNRAYDQSPTVSVSRHHAIFHHDGNGVVLENLSSDGTGIEDGRKNIRKGQTASLSASAATLDFGFIRLYACAQTCRQKKLKDMCANCMGRPIKSLVLQRADGLPEVFLCVWQCCDLGILSPDLEGFILYRRNGGFMLQTPSERLYNLELGLEVDEKGRKINVSHVIKMGFAL